MVKEDQGDDDCLTCEHCQGRFLPEDMDGEHCRECAAEIFGAS